MARTRTPGESVRRYIQPFERAVRCIAHGTLISASSDRNAGLNTLFAFAVNQGIPLRLQSRLAAPVYLAFGHEYVIAYDPSFDDESYRIHNSRYRYEFSLTDERELLSFHWTPEATGNQRQFPHLHVGAAMLRRDAPLLPGSFHKRHIPTGQVSIERIVRFAIEELEVILLVDSWRDVLEVSQTGHGRNTV